MKSEDALNFILANSCPNHIENGISVFIITGHCLKFRITAKLIDEEPFRYEILNCESSYDF